MPGAPLSMSPLAKPVRDRVAVVKPGSAFIQAGRGARAYGRYVGVPPKPFAASRARRRLPGFKRITIEQPP
ncbi:hypothetical protein EMIT0373P_11451 [Pseudomonas chlororaphis]